MDELVHEGLPEVAPTPEEVINPEAQVAHEEGTTVPEGPLEVTPEAE